MGCPKEGPLSGGPYFNRSYNEQLFDLNPLVGHRILPDIPRYLSVNFLPWQLGQRCSKQPPKLDVEAISNIYGRKQYSCSKAIESRHRYLQQSPIATGQSPKH